MNEVKQTILKFLLLLAVLLLPAICVELACPDQVVPDYYGEMRKADELEALFLLPYEPDPYDSLYQKIVQDMLDESEGMEGFSITDLRSRKEDWVKYNPDTGNNEPGIYIHLLLRMTSAREPTCRFISLACLWLDAETQKYQFRGFFTIPGGKRYGI